MFLHIARSWFMLLSLEFVMRHGGFPALHRKVRCASVFRSTTPKADVATLVRALDYACVFYVKPVLCLQRSAATVMLLRSFGHAGQLVVGMQLLPFESHAWAEVDGVVVNDKPYMRTTYQVLESC